MSKATSRTRFDILTVMGSEFGRDFQAALGQSLISEMKSDIAQGNSPVRGEGRFAPYKNPDRYPGDRKPRRMVNLELTGEMMTALTFEPVDGRNAITIGYLKGSGAVRDRAARHNSGDGVPQRKTIPWEQGDEMSVRITRRLIEIYKDRLARAIDRGNN